MRRIRTATASALIYIALAGSGSAQGPGPVLALQALPAPCSAVSDTGELAIPLPMTRSVEAAPLTAFLNSQAQHAVQAGILAAHREERAHHFQDARLHARRAVALDPSDLQARYWLAAALGLLTETAGLRDQLRLGQAAYEIAAGILDVDPDHAGAHHLIGRFNAEVMRLSGMSRFIAGRLLGSDLIRQASWTTAEEHLRAAVRAEPRRLIHRVELARVYADTGRPELAREQLYLVFRSGETDRVSPVFRAEARALLRAIDQND